MHSIEANHSFITGSHVATTASATAAAVPSSVATIPTTAISSTIVVSTSITAVSIVVPSSIPTSLITSTAHDHTTNQTDNQQNHKNAHNGLPNLLGPFSERPNILTLLGISVPLVILCASGATAWAGTVLTVQRTSLAARSARVEALSSALIASHVGRTNFAVRVHTRSAHASFWEVAIYATSATVGRTASVTLRV